MTESSVVSFDCDSIDFELEHKAEVRAWILNMAKRSQRLVENIEYVFCSDQRLLEINMKYLQHDYFTDIITFPLQDDPLEATIFISIERVQDNFSLYQSNFVDELHRVMIHGLLHLLGHSDKTDSEKFAMRAKEKECLELRTF